MAARSPKATGEVAGQVGEFVSSPGLLRSADAFVEFLDAQPALAQRSAQPFDDHFAFSV